MSAGQTELAIVGGGPGGYCAALYAARSGLQAVVLEQLSAGGQMATANWIENYPGLDEGIDGYTLSEKMRAGAERQGAKTQMTAVTELRLRENPKAVVTVDGTLYANAVILAMGTVPKMLHVPGETELLGRGVSYCAACDGMFFRGRTAAVIGGGNNAVSSAILLSRLCESVVVFHRRDCLRAEYRDRRTLQTLSNVRLMLNAEILELEGSQKLTGVRWRDVQTGGIHTFACDAAFICIGRIPQTELLRGQLELTEEGYIPASESTQTAIPGVFAAGDLREKPLRQIVTACADGAVAAWEAAQYLQKEKRYDQ